MTTADAAGMAGRKFDLAIVGGGIFGAGAAREAALQGLSVALLEAGDIAHGTSSRSSKLVHGGLRYLETFQFRLVAESLRERHVLHRLAPHLVRPLPFLVPIWRGAPRGRLKTRLGLWLYDRLARAHTEYRHEGRNAAELLALEPALASDGLRGGASYTDFQTDDARLALECALDAAGRGAAVANDREVVSIEPDAGSGFRVGFLDHRTETRGVLFARAVIDAAGPWLDRIRGMAAGGAVPATVKVRLTKGVHITTRPILARHALLLSARSDGRVFFAIPWKGVTLIGTTDTDHTGSPGSEAPSPADVGYLLSEVNRALAPPGLGHGDVIGAFAGLRTLVQSTARHPSDNPREQVIFEEPRGVVHIAGGKLTTFRLVAREALAKAAARIGARLDDGTLSATTPLPGGAVAFEPHAIDSEIEARSREFGLPRDAARRIVETWGSRARQVFDYMKLSHRLAEPIAPGIPETGAELRFAVRHEWAIHPEDFLRRRTARSLLTRLSEDDILAVADAMGDILDWSPERRRSEAARMTEPDGLA